ncbi:DUF6229 family protein [Lysobacter sp. yr284]|uniref:DUF6229 family protein n=1 Tax=Lysobacter sp. yr284 TaxID=1761791 RepID=UPI000B870A13|nr:DUF6229 family protein [Lysobacter sp. yr284]
MEDSTMQQNDDVVSGWLNGSDSVDGQDNPAGSLFIEGQAAAEAAMTGTGMRATLGACGTLGGTSCSYAGGCLCC